MTKPLRSQPDAMLDQSHQHLFVLAMAFLDRIEDAQRLASVLLEEEGLSPSLLAKRKIAAGILEWMKGDVSAGLLAMEALIPYRKSKAHWVREARIWRAAMLSEFSDFGSIRLLEALWNEAKSDAKTDLSDLALTALLEAKNRFNQSFDDRDIAAAMAVTDPGLRMLSCRMVGLPCEALEASDAVLTLLPWRMPGEWFWKHYPNLRQMRDETFASIFPHLPNTPRMRTMACATCDNRCCYDGVYVTKPEENRIRALRKKAPAYFLTVPEVFAEDGEWSFLFHGKRTKLRDHVYTKPDYPTHFGRTKCVLALPNGECAPQRAGADLGYHPWRFKPSICWKFPLIGLFNDNAMEKPHYFGEPDPHAYDDQQRGYLSFLPCATVDENGLSWKEVYRHELLHFLRHEKPSA